MHFVQSRDTRLGSCGTCAWRPSKRCTVVPTARRSHRSTTALALLRTWPDMHERTEQELLVQKLAPGPALVATQGWGAPESASRLQAGLRAGSAARERAIRAQVLFGLAGLHAVAW